MTEVGTKSGREEGKQRHRVLKLTRTLNTSVRFLKDRSGSNVFDALVTIGFVDLQPAATEALVPYLPPVLKARFERRPLDQRDSLLGCCFCCVRADVAAEASSHAVLGTEQEVRGDR